jgi:DNA-binding SARP family transcriptional activator
VAVFEEAYSRAQGIAGHVLNAPSADSLKVAVELYQGDLLESCYQDWCLYERERLQNMYLSMLDKLMGYCDAHHDFETSVMYGMRILRYDRAREHTHRWLMRLHSLRGDRTAALRQYERCIAALDEELGVKPAYSTVTLYEQIRGDQVADSTRLPIDASAKLETVRPLTEALGQVEHLRGSLAAVECQVHELEQSIQAIERVLILSS